MRDRVVIAAVVCLLFAHTAWSQAAVTEKTLSNGLKVIMEVDRSSSAVSVQLWYRAGSTTDTVGMRGRAAMVERMMFRGTPSYPAQEFRRTIASVGGEAGSALYEDGVGYFEIVPSTHLERALLMEADRMCNLLVEPFDLEEVRAALLENIASLTESPVTGVISQIAQEAFGECGYGLPLSGHPLDISRMKRDDILRFYHAYYVPDNAALILVGDFEPAVAFALVEKHFGGIPKGGVSRAAEACEPVQNPLRRVSVKKPQVFPLTTIGFLAPPITESDSYALEVFAHIAVKGVSPLLSEVLTAPAAPCAGVGGDYTPKRHTGLIWFYGMAKTGGTYEAVEDAMWGAIDLLRAGAITQERVNAAKHTIIALYYMDRGDVVSRGRELGLFEVRSSWRLRDEYESGIRRVTLSDVERVVRRYILKDNSIVGWLMPKGASEEPSQGPKGN